MTEVTPAQTMLLDDEQKLLRKVNKIREDIVDNFIEVKGLPLRPMEITAVNGVLDSMSKQTFDEVKVRKDAKELQNTEDTTAIIQEVLSKRQNTAVRVNVTAVPELSNRAEVVLDLVPDETTVEYKALEIKDITKD